MAKQHNYIIRMRDEHYSIVGPFETTEALVAWGRADQEASGDDPRWQSIYLADPRSVPVVAPEGATP